MDSTVTFSAIVALVAAAGGALANPIVADSVADFSGSQGGNGWHYGWYSGDDISVGLGGLSADVSAFNQFGSYNAVTARWAIDPSSAGGDPTSGATPGSYAVITAELMHPHAALPSANVVAEDQWVSRRWVSNTSGLMTLAGSIAHYNYGGFMIGNGTEAHILVDGVAVFSYDVGFQDFDGTSYSFDVNVVEGTLIEMLVGAKGDPLFDATRFDMQITAVPAPGAAALIGLGGLLAGVRRRR